MIRDTAIYALIEDTLDSVPDRSGDLSQVIKRGRFRQRRNLATYGVAGVAAVFVTVVPIALTVGGEPQTIGAGGYSDTEVVFDSGFSVTVAGKTVESNGALVFKGQRADPPTSLFDISKLGNAHAISERGASNLIVPPGEDPFQDNALNADMLVYLGDIAGAQLALQQTNGQTCIFFGNGTEATGGGFCDVNARPTIGYSADPEFPDSDGGWFVWSMLLPDTAVVVVTLQDGTTHWQVPVARTVFFSVADLDALTHATATAFNSGGAVIGEETPVLLEGHEAFLSH